MAVINFTNARSPSALQKYFSSALSIADYYADAQELSWWDGRLAEQMGLKGPVQKREFYRLAAGLHAFDDSPLTLRHKANRRPAVDVTVSLSKDSSLAWAFGSDAERCALDEALVRVVRKLIARMEQDAATRVRIGGADGIRKTENLLCAVFLDREARPVDGHTDPDSHAHCVIMNATNDPVEQRRKALEIGELRRNAPIYEAWFETEWNDELRDLGYQLVPHEKTHRIVGISQSVRERFSRRSAQIENEAKRRGIVDPKQKAGLAVKTRSKKGIPRSAQEMRVLWESRVSAEELSILRSLRSQRATAGKNHDQDHDTQEPRREAIQARNDLRTQQKAGIHDHTTAGRRTDSSEEKRRVPPGPEPGHSAPTISKQARDAIARTAQEVFDRNAVVRESDFINRSLRYASRCKADEIAVALRNLPQFICRTCEGIPYITTQSVLREEEALVRDARKARGTCFPLSSRTYQSKDLTLSQNQRSAISRLMASRNGIDLLICSGSGRGKVIQELKSAVEAGGNYFKVFAPSAAASNVALPDDGFKSAKTVARLLVDTTLQATLGRQTVVFIDEATLLGTKTGRALFTLRKERSCRLILVGDVKLNKSVERGSLFRLLEEEAGLKAVRTSSFGRDRGLINKAKAHLAEHRTEKGLDVLERMGAIQESENQKLCHQRLTRECLPSLRSKKPPLIVVPTHQEGKALTQEIRKGMRENKMLGRDRVIRQLTPIFPTVAEKTDPAYFKKGMVIQFHKNGRHLLDTFKAGERWTVRRRDPFGNVMVSKGVVVRALPFRLVDRFQLYEKSRIRLARGDLVRFTANGKSVNKSMFRGQPFKLANSSVHRVTGFTALGHIRLDKGVIVDKKFGHLTHGYCQPSHAAQRRSAMKVFAAISRSSFGGTNSQQLYATVNAAKSDVRLYTDDVAGLRNAVARPRTALTATEIARTENVGKTRPTRHFINKCVNVATRAARASRAWAATKFKTPGPGRSRVQEGHCR